MFGVNYTVGVDGINLPAPFFPKFKRDYVKGFRVDIAHGEDGEFTLEVQDPCHLKSVCISATGYSDGDNWDLLIEDEPWFESIYMKELGEIKILTVYPDIETNSIIKFQFHNTGPAKVVFVDLHFLQ